MVKVVNLLAIYETLKYMIFHSTQTGAFYCQKLGGIVSKHKTQAAAEIEV